MRALLGPLKISISNLCHADFRLQISGRIWSRGSVLFSAALSAPSALVVIVSSNLPLVETCKVRATLPAQLHV